MSTTLPFSLLSSLHFHNLNSHTSPNLITSSPNSIPSAIHFPSIKSKPTNPSLHHPPQSTSSSLQLLQETHISKPKNHDQDELHDWFYYLLQLSITSRNLNHGKEIHAAITKSLFSQETRLNNNLITMYLKLGHISDAHRVFNAFDSPNVVSWSAMVSGFAKCGELRRAVKLFFEMRIAGIEPNEFSYVAVLTACIRMLDLELGFQFHALVIKTGYCLCIHVANALMGVYVKCGFIKLALQLFDEMPERDVVSWNTVISCFARDLQCKRAFGLLREMRSSGFSVDHYSISSLLMAASEVLGFKEGKQVHAHALRRGFDSNVSVNNALIGFYTKCGTIDNVVGVFRRMPVRDVFSWTGMVTGFAEFGLVESMVDIFEQMPEKNHVSYNALLGGFSRNGRGLQALELFVNMVKNRMELSGFTLTSVVNACAMISEAEESKQIHGFVMKTGFGSSSCIEGALMDMYAKCGRMTDAQLMFDQWGYNRSSMVWTSLISGYAQDGKPDEALSLFHKMWVEQNLFVDEFAMATIFDVCGTLGFLEKGKQLHSFVLKTGFVSDLAVGNAIVSMYSECCSLEDAHKLFNLMPEHDRVSWNTMIAGCVLHRCGDMALNIWTQMEKMGTAPDHITFISILSSCRDTKSNSVDTCFSLFRSMKSHYAIKPDSEHYASMIDVLGYWGCFDEAEELIRNMPFEPGSMVWRALLNSCRLRSNMILGRKAAHRLLALKPQDPATYILVSNLYSASGRWHCSERVREEMRNEGIKKHPARSWIIHRNQVHSFYARDGSHPQTKDIYSGLDILILECSKAGYEPDTSFVLHEVEEYQKTNFLFYHSSKLAVTYGLLMTPPGKPVRVVKNIHLCGDCHTFMKYLSLATGREIFLRDATGFHFFGSGVCSCGDYW